MEQQYTPEELIKKYNAGTCSEAEKAIVESWHLNDLAQSSFEPAAESISAVHAKMRESVIAHAQKSGVIHRLWPRIAAAAAILIFVSVGVYTYFHKTQPASLYANDIAPGTAKPFLTLANGQKVIIGDKPNAMMAKQGAVMIRQNAAGQVIYTASTNGVTAAPFNTLTNPRGSKVVSLVLPDGTLAKLDAASSITYQTAFTGKTRNVTTTGKVYFAVTYNKNQPFFTSTKGQTIQDLGTQFIVDAYDDESTIKTTLLEGSVSVSKADKSALLKPGQQTIVQSDNNLIKVKAADVDNETAWLSNDFDFHNEDLGSIMRQLARVYNIDVTYKDNVQNLLFYGMVARSRNISAVLNLMESTGKIHFEINGRRVMVIAGAR